MTFPVPTPSAAESNDAARDEDKRRRSPPSSFYAQSQAILTAIRYFEELDSGYPGAARKHRNRIRGALLVQLLAAFEYTMKDFIAQTLDATHVYDDDVKSWAWLEIDVATVMSTREGFTRLGAVLIHPLLGWQTPETMNSRYMDVFARAPIAGDEISQLRDLWIVRHSIAHNAGFVTEADARRLRSADLRDRQILIDLTYVESAVAMLRTIVGRLESLIGPSLLKRWFDQAAAKTWTRDKDEYVRLKLLTTFVRSRPRDLAEPTETEYAADLARYGQ